jgi:hypothetical protein
MSEPKEAYDFEQLPGDGKMPLAFRLWPFGTRWCEQGGFTLTKEWAARMVKYRDQIPIHIEGLASPAAGWGDLQIRDDGAWLVNIHWTPEGRKNPKGFLAPSLLQDGKGSIQKFLDVLVTQQPALYSEET